MLLNQEHFLTVPVREQKNCWLALGERPQVQAILSIPQMLALTVVLSIRLEPFSVGMLFHLPATP